MISVIAFHSLILMTILSSSLLLFSAVALFIMTFLLRHSLVTAASLPLSDISAGVSSSEVLAAVSSLVAFDWLLVRLLVGLHALSSSGDFLIYLMILSPFKNSSLTIRLAFSLGGVFSLLACIGISTSSMISAISSSNSRYLLVIFLHLFSSLTTVDVSWSPVVFTERGEAPGSIFPSPFVQSLGDHRVEPGTLLESPTGPGGSGTP